MRSGGRVGYAAGHVRGPVEDVVPFGRWVDHGWREPQVGDGRLRVRYAQIHPGPVSDLVERHFEAGHDALPANFYGRRFTVTGAATGPLRRDHAAAHAHTDHDGQQQGLAKRPPW